MHLCEDLTRKYNEENKLYHESKPCTKRHKKDYIKRDKVNDYISKAVSKDPENVLSLFMAKNKKIHYQVIEKEYSTRNQQINECEIELQKLAGSGDAVDFLSYVNWDYENTDASFLMWRCRKLKIECKNLIDIRKKIDNLIKIEKNKF